MHASVIGMRAARQHRSRCNSILSFFAVFVILLLFRTESFARPSGSDPNSYFIEILTFGSAKQPGTTFMEIFVGLPTQKLQYLRTASNFRANYELAVTLLNGMGHEVQRAIYIDSVDAEPSAAILNVNLHRLRYSFEVPPANYRVEFKLTDLNSLSGFRFFKNITVPDYNGADLTISDMQLSHSMIRCNETSALVKNSWKIVPNILRVFTNEDKNLNVYSEVYNLDFRLDRANKGFATTYFIRDERGCDVRSLEQVHQKPTNATVLTACLPIDDLDSGLYQLILKVRDFDSGRVVEKSTTFRMSNPLAL
jgi:hypothetical protein